MWLLGTDLVTGLIAKNKNRRRSKSGKKYTIFEIRSWTAGVNSEIFRTAKLRELLTFDYRSYYHDLPSRNLPVNQFQQCRPRVHYDKDADFSNFKRASSSLRSIIHSFHLSKTSVASLYSQLTRVTLLDSVSTRSRMPVVSGTSVVFSTDSTST